MFVSFPMFEIFKSPNFKDYLQKEFKNFLLKHMIFNFLSKPDFISYDINDFDVRILMSIKKNFIFGWTYRNKEKKAQFKKYLTMLYLKTLKLKNFWENEMFVYIIQVVKIDNLDS